VFVRGESGITEERQGRFLFQKPLRVRWSTDAPFEELLIVTDDLIWQYDAFEEIAYKAPIEALDDKNAFLQVLFGLSSLQDTFKITIQPDRSGDDGLAHLLLEPYEPASSLMRAEIWLEPKTALIRRIEIKDAFGNLNRVSLKKIDKNPRVPAEAFTFTPPPGVEVEDRT
jgi:outer membrane lipoprotein carrier protein